MLVQNIMFLACICSVMPEIVIAGRDYYEVLGLTRGATDRQIKKAYRKLVMQYHPDKNKDTGAEEKFREIVTAYEVLSDEEKKRKYDQFGEAAFGNGGQPHGQPFSFDFQEIFKKFNEHPFDKRNSQYHGDFGGFHFDEGRTCRTVTQRVGNMVSTYTQCS